MNWAYFSAKLKNPTVYKYKSINGKNMGTIVFETEDNVNYKDLFGAQGKLYNKIVSICVMCQTISAYSIVNL